MDEQRNDDGGRLPLDLAGAIRRVLEAMPLFAPDCYLKANVIRVAPDRWDVEDMAELPLDEAVLALDPCPWATTEGSHV